MNFDFSVYKENSIYLKMFEVLIKQSGYTRDAFLIENGIATSSFRRARDSEQSVGNDINKKLSGLFGLRMPTIDEVCQLEHLYNCVYRDVVYKNYENFDIYINQIDNLYKLKLTIFPLLDVIMLFIECNSNESQQTIQDKISKIIDKINAYKPFYTTQVQEIVDVINLINTSKPSFIDYANRLDNSLLLFCLASKFCLNKQFEASLYICTLCDSKLYEEKNYKRQLYLNLTVLKCYCNLKMYSYAKELAMRQLAALSSFKTDKYLLKKTKYLYLVSLIGLNQYDLINDDDFISPLDTTDIIVKMVISKKKNEIYDINSLSLNDENVKNYILKAYEEIFKKKKIGVIQRELKLLIE